jgi:oligopeptide transport system substrate-binding protein
MIVALLLMACTTTAPAGPTSQVGQPDPNGELTTNTGSEPDTIDPQKESFVNEVAQTMMVFEGLMTLDAKTLKPIPASAKEDPKVSADGLTYTFTLRDGLKYSDGTAVTAKDFMYGYIRLCDPATAGEYAFTGYVIVGCEAWNNMDPKKSTPADLNTAKGKLGIKVNGDKEISFTLTEPAPYFTSIAAIWVGVPTRESDVTKGGDKWTEPATFIGNGAFKLTEWKHNEKLVFTRNDNYRTPAKLAKWTKVMINENAVSFAAYRNNELDFQGVAAENLRTVDGDADLKSQVVDIGGSCTNYYGFNLAKPPFTDKKVRQAFAKGFDREAFVKDIQKIGQPAYSFIPPGRPGHDAGDKFQTFDAAGAKALLQGSSFFGKPELNTIKFTYRTSATNKTRVEWVQQQWKNNLGVEVALDPVDATTFSQLVKKAETTPQMFLLGWCEDYPDPQDWLTTVFHSSSTVTRTGYKSADFDKLVKDADKERDPAKRADGYQKASRLLSEDAPIAFYLWSATKYMMKPWVKGVTPSTLDFEYGIYKIYEIYVTKKS